MLAHRLAPLLILAVALAAGCGAPRERQVVQSNDAIEVTLEGQRDRLMKKARQLERTGRGLAAREIYQALVTLHPDDQDVLDAMAANVAAAGERDGEDSGDGLRP